MKKFLNIILVIMIICIFAGCNNNENNTVENKSEDIIEQSGDETTGEEYEPIVSEPLNEQFGLEDAFESVADVTTLDDTAKLSDSEIEAEFNLGKYRALEKMAWKKETADDYEEILLVKIGEAEQLTELYPLLSLRLTQLQNDYAENESISAILNDSGNIVIKQQGGILISIISKNAKAIEEKMQESF